MTNIKRWADCILYTFAPWVDLGFFSFLTFLTESPSSPCADLGWADLGFFFFLLRSLSIQVLSLLEFFDWTSFFFSCAALSKSSFCWTFGSTFSVSSHSSFGSSFSLPSHVSFVALADCKLSLSSSYVERQSSAFSNITQHSGEWATLCAKLWNLWDINLYRSWASSFGFATTFLPCLSSIFPLRSSLVHLFKI